MPSKDKVFDGLSWNSISFALVVNCVAVFYYGIIVKVVWNWFIPEAFAGARGIDYSTAVGMTLIVAIGLFMLRSTRDNDGWGEAWYYIVETVFTTAWIIPLAAVVHYWF